MYQHFSPNPAMREAVLQGMRMYLVEAAGWDQIATALRTVPDGRQKVVHETGLATGFNGAAELAGDEGALRRWRRGLAIYNSAERQAALEIR